MALRHPNITFKREIVRATIILVVVFSSLFSFVGVGATLEDVSPHFGTNTAIIWQVPTNDLSAHFWTYKRRPQIFSAAAISNGVVLAGFQKKGFPRASTNQIVLWADHSEMEPKPPNFSLFPEYGQMSFTLGDRAPNSANAVNDEVAVKRAFKCAAQLGVNLSELLPTNTATSGLYGVFLTRQVDGVSFRGDDEGFQIQFGKDGKILQFCLLWPKLERDEYCATATPGEIIRCIRSRKTPVVPADDESGYFSRVRNIEHARRLTITRLRPYYADGRFGENPLTNGPSKHVTPIAELETVADFGTNAVPVKLYSPLVSVDVKRLLDGGNAAVKRKEKQ
jgi:hypothetical protein